MFQQFLSESRFLHLPLAASVLFFLVFAGVIVLILRGLLKRQSFDHVAALPLDDDEPHDDQEGARS